MALKAIAAYPQLNSAKDEEIAIKHSDGTKQAFTIILVNSDRIDRTCPECDEEKAMEYEEVLSVRQHLWAFTLFILL